MRGPLRGACSEGERCEDYGRLEPRFGTLLARVVTRFAPKWRGMPHASVVAGYLVPPVATPHRVLLPAASHGPARQSLPCRISRIRAVVENQPHRHRTGPSAADSWNRRHRNGANHGGSGGRDALYEGFAHASRAAAPNRPQSSFCYTRCPYTARSAFF